MPTYTFPSKTSLSVAAREPMRSYMLALSIRQPVKDEGDFGELSRAVTR